MMNFSTDLPTLLNILIMAAVFFLAAWKVMGLLERYGQPDDLSALLVTAVFTTYALLFAAAQYCGVFSLFGDSVLPLGGLLAVGIAVELLFGREDILKKTRYGYILRMQGRLYPVIREGEELVLYSARKKTALFRFLPQPNGSWQVEDLHSPAFYRLVPDSLEEGYTLMYGSEALLRLQADGRGNWRIVEAG